MNGIHEVTGSTPVWSTNFPKVFAVNYLQTAPALVTLRAYETRALLRPENTAAPGRMRERCVLHCLT
jgi:hypothetical protein